MVLHIGASAKSDVGALFARHVAADRSSSKDSSMPSKPADSTADPSSATSFQLLTCLMLAEVLTACRTSSKIPTKLFALRVVTDVEPDFLQVAEQCVGSAGPFLAWFMIRFFSD